LGKIGLLIHDRFFFKCLPFCWKDVLAELKKIVFWKSYNGHYCKQKWYFKSKMKFHFVIFSILPIVFNRFYNSKIWTWDKYKIHYIRFCFQKFRFYPKNIDFSQKKIRFFPKISDFSQKKIRLFPKKSNFFPNQIFLKNFDFYPKNKNFSERLIEDYLRNLMCIVNSFVFIFIFSMRWYTEIWFITLTRAGWNRPGYWLRMPLRR
jgi:hypothetical protein